MEENGTRGIRLISQDERLVHQVGESRIYYRRPSTSDREALRRRFIAVERGRDQFDAEGFMGELLRRYVLGWSGVRAWDGQDVPFDAARLGLLPEQVKLDLLAAFSAPDGRTEQDLKN